MNKIRMDKKWQLRMLILVSGFLIFVLNCWTPLFADDYSYSFSRITGEPMSGFMDMVLSMYDHYMGWGGRILTHFLASIFIFLPKWIFNILNTAVYLAFAWYLYKFATIHSKEPQPVFYALVQLGLWFFLPRYGQNILWLIGSCNYLWAALFILAFI